MLKLVAESHVDHVPVEVIAFVLEKFKTRDGFFIESFELPAELPALENALYGPVAGDPPVTEATTEQRPGRSYPSRVVRLPKRESRVCSVIAGPYRDEACVLYTVFGGPPTPKEPTDPSLKEEERAAAVEFWSVHALSMNPQQ